METTRTPFTDTLCRYIAEAQIAFEKHGCNLRTRTERLEELWFQADDVIAAFMKAEERDDSFVMQALLERFNQLVDKMRTELAVAKT